MHALSRAASNWVAAVVSAAIATCLFGGCRHGSRLASESGAWPELPRTLSTARELVADRTLRREAALAEAELEPEALLRHLSADGVVAGEGATKRFIEDFLDRGTASGHDTYVLFGTFHDAGGQVDAFRRLIGPDGLQNLTAITAEQFRATGRWRSVDATAQRGDDADIAAYTERGDTAAFARLGGRHTSSDYVAWKLGYVPSVLELLVTARALSDTPGSHSRFLGCDMPTPVQHLIDALPEDERLRLRELHCLTALEGALQGSGSGRRVAMLWGQAHLESVRRFLPPDARVLSLYVFGFRPGEGTTESKLGAHLALADPMLVPLNARRDVAALLYPDSVMGASMDRVRDASVTTNGQPTQRRLIFTTSARARLVLDGRTMELDPSVSTPIDVAPGDHLYSAQLGDLRFVGGVSVPNGEEVTLDLDPTTRTIHWTERQSGDGG